MRFLVALVLSLTFALVGSETETLRSVPLVDEVNSNLYIIGPGDILWFSSQGGIPGDPESCAEASLVEVTPDGYAVLPSVGAWKVSGMTLSEAAATLERGFAARFPGLSGFAGLAMMRVFQVPVTGHVNNPGIVEVTGADGLVAVIEIAGGLSSTGTMTGILVIGRDGDTTRVDITEFLMNGDMGSNPYLSLGDRVHVPEASEFVWLEGAIRFELPQSVDFHEASNSVVWSRSRRGMTEFIPGESVNRLISRVGGIEPWAILDSCYISRTTSGDGTTRIPAPLDDPEVEAVLQPGDVVVVPGIPPVVSVVGEVHSPGVYPHTAGMGADFYISQAGGFLRAARRSGTDVILPDGGEIDADRISSVPSGSTINVPRKALVGWEDPLLILTSVASIVIAWKSIF